MTKLGIFAVVASFASAIAVAAAQQTPASTPPPASVPAAAPTEASAASTAAASEADDTAALIAKANAAAAASAKLAPAAPNVHFVDPHSVGPRSVDPRVVPMAPSAVARKKANDFGFHAEIYSGRAYFCKDDATLGTRLKSKKCIDADQFEDYAIQMQVARDTMKKDVCQGGKASATLGPCGGSL